MKNKNHKIKRDKMKNFTLFLIACGLIFAASPVVSNLENNTVYASPDWRRLSINLASPDWRRLIIIPIPVDTAKSSINLASPDWKRFLPKPIVIPVGEKTKAEIQIALS
ncbi:hypothetical protein HY768_08245 [candidate division TA06 bacterium]|uniref:Gingipain propeptide domain-containing protein n=1 Tax=candidate division TA06 bacterium TaxID=2250710 RepID=A0A933IEZ1_UNCT6|nr:hypothetical protein [candidate division TA06 bacterium]